MALLLLSGLAAGCIGASPGSSGTQATSPILSIGDVWQVEDGRWHIESESEGPNRHGLETARAVLIGTGATSSWLVDRISGDVASTRRTNDADEIPTYPGNRTGIIKEALVSNPLLALLPLQYPSGEARWFGNPAQYQVQSVDDGTLRVTIPIQNQTFRFDLSGDGDEWTLKYDHFPGRFLLQRLKAGTEELAIAGDPRLPETVRPTPAAFDQGTCDYPFSWSHVLDALRMHPASALWLSQHPEAVVDLFVVRQLEPPPAAVYRITVELVDQSEAVSTVLIARDIQDPLMTVALWRTFEADPDLQATSSVPIDVLVCRFETWTGVSPDALTRIEWVALTPQAGPDDAGIFVRLERQDEHGETIVLELEGTLAGLQKGLRLPPGVID